MTSLLGDTVHDAICLTASALQALQQQLATEWRLKNAHDTRELAKMGAEVARQHAARVIQRAWRLFRTRPRVAAKPTGEGFSQQVKQLASGGHLYGCIAVYQWDTGSGNGLVLVSWLVPQSRCGRHIVADRGEGND